MTSLTGGTSYTFRLFARNIHGWSASSSELIVVASGIPATPAAPTTLLQSSDVRITWLTPANNYATITAYKVFIKNSVGNYLEETTYCDASRDPVFSNLYCLVPMSHLRNSYGLPYDTLIEVIVQAYNINGWSPLSSANTEGV